MSAHLAELLPLPSIVTQSLCSDRHPTFQFEIDENVSISSSNQLTRRATELGGTPSRRGFISGPKVRILSTPNSQTSKKCFEAIEMVQAKSTIMNVDSALAWMSCCETNAKGIPSPEAFNYHIRLSENPLQKQVSVDGEMFHLCCTRPTYMPGLALRRGSIWLLDGDVAFLNQLLHVSLENLSGYRSLPSFCSTPKTGSLSAAMKKMVKTICDHEDAGTIVPKTLVNVVSDSSSTEDTVKSICDSHLNMPDIVIKHWSVTEFRTMWPTLAPPCAPTSTEDLDVEVPHSDVQIDDIATDQCASDTGFYTRSLGILAAIFDDGTACVLASKFQASKKTDLTEILKPIGQSVIDISVCFRKILVRTKDRLVLLSYGHTGAVSIVQNIKHRCHQAQISFVGGQWNQPCVLALGAKGGLKSCAAFSVNTSIHH